MPTPEHEQGLRAAEQFARWHLGERGWGPLIVNAYLHPAETIAAIRAEEAPREKKNRGMKLEDGEYYDGRFEVTIAGETHIVRMRSVREGAMREFMHLERDELLGCASVNWVEKHVRGPL